MNGFKFFIILFLSVLPLSVQAYIGPGAGLTAIGAVFALFGAILLAIVGFFWYPIKRIFGKSKKTEEKNNEKDE